MADFTPYGYGTKEEQQAYDKFYKYWVKPAEYERYSGDWDAYQNAYYNYTKNKIEDQYQTVYDTFMNRQRKLGVGDSPTTDALWASKYLPEYLSQYEQASNAAQTARAGLEMSDLSQYNAAMQSRSLNESNALINYMQQAFQNDLARWSVNTNAGFQNRALSQAQSANDTDWGSLLGNIIGQIPAAVFNIAGAGNLSGLWGSGATTALGASELGTVASTAGDVASAFAFFL